jgi:hypothetical protein
LHLGLGTALGCQDAFGRRPAVVLASKALCPERGPGQVVCQRDAEQVYVDFGCGPDGAVLELVRLDTTGAELLLHREDEWQPPLPFQSFAAGGGLLALAGPSAETPQEASVLVLCDPGETQPAELARLPWRGVVRQTCLLSSPDPTSARVAVLSAVPAGGLELAVLRIPVLAGTGDVEVLGTVDLAAWTQPVGWSSAEPPTILGCGETTLVCGVLGREPLLRIGEDDWSRAELLWTEGPGEGDAALAAGDVGGEFLIDGAGSTLRWRALGAAATRLQWIRASPGETRRQQLWERELDVGGAPVAALASSGRVHLLTADSEWHVFCADSGDRVGRTALRSTRRVGEPQGIAAVVEGRGVLITTLSSRALLDQGGAVGQLVYFAFDEDWPGWGPCPAAVSSR